MSSRRSLKRLPRAGAGIPDLEAAVAKAPSPRRDEAAAELRFARAAAIHFQSVVNQSRYVAARDALADRSQTFSAEQRAAPAGNRQKQPGVRDRFGAPVVSTGARRFTDRLRGRESVFLRPSGSGGESGQLPLVAGTPGEATAEKHASQVHRQVPKFQQQSGGFQGAR